MTHPSSFDAPNFPAPSETPRAQRTWWVSAGTIGLIIFLAIGVFWLKKTVKDQADTYRHLIALLEKEQRAIHVLKAEWAHLSDPERVRALAERHLGMGPLGRDHVVDGTLSLATKSAVIEDRETP